jgi:hypothetical protein
MGHTQMLVLALANVPTILTVLIGILLNNGRFTDLNSRFTSIETRLATVEHRLTNLDQKFDLSWAKSSTSTTVSPTSKPSFTR